MQGKPISFRCECGAHLLTTDHPEVFICPRPHMPPTMYTSDELKAHEERVLFGDPDVPKPRGIIHAKGSR